MPSPTSTPTLSSASSPPPRRWRGPRASTRAATGWCSTSATTPSTACPTSTSTWSGDGSSVGRLIDELRLLVEAGQSVDPVNVLRVIDMVQHDERPSEVLTAQVLKAAKGRSVRPKTTGQKRYADAIAANVLTFGIGPAGTGKSYLAVALAVQALQAKQVERILLTRPAVEAGERLGFLPGDLMA